MLPFTATKATNITAENVVELSPFNFLPTLAMLINSHCSSQHHRTSKIKFIILCNRFTHSAELFPAPPCLKHTKKNNNNVHDPFSSARRNFPNFLTTYCSFPSLYEFISLSLCGRQRLLCCWR